MCFEICKTVQTGTTPLESMAWLWVPAALVALACVLLPKSWQEKIPITSCFLLYFWATLRPLHHFLGKTQDLPHVNFFVIGGVVVLLTAMLWWFNRARVLSQDWLFGGMLFYTFSTVPICARYMRDTRHGIMKFSQNELVEYALVWDAWAIAGMVLWVAVVAVWLWSVEFFRKSDMFNKFLLGFVILGFAVVCFQLVFNMMPPAGYVVEKAMECHATSGLF